MPLLPAAGVSWAQWLLSCWNNGLGVRASWCQELATYGQRSSEATCQPPAWQRWPKQLLKREYQALKWLGWSPLHVVQAGVPVVAAEIQTSGARHRGAPRTPTGTSRSATSPQLPSLSWGPIISCGVNTIVCLPRPYSCQVSGTPVDLLLPHELFGCLMGYHKDSAQKALLSYGCSRLSHVHHTLSSLPLSAPAPPLHLLGVCALRPELLGWPFPGGPCTQGAP